MVEPTPAERALAREIAEERICCMNAKTCKVDAMVVRIAQALAAYGAACAAKARTAALEEAAVVAEGWDFGAPIAKEIRALGQTKLRP